MTAILRASTDAGECTRRFSSGDNFFSKTFPPTGRPEDRRIWERPKQPVSLRLDADVIAHFRRSGRGWQSRINSVLRKAAKLPVEKKRKA
jgi:uncharacterized protein (DUF4415 family)